MLIGLYGGTFDPVHNAHIKIAKEVFRQFNLDELWFIPAKIPPHKISSVIADERHRVNMLELAIKDLQENFKICKYELEQENVSYSYLTLSEFKNKYPEHQFLFIIGEDSLNDFEKWKNPEIISGLVELIVVPRFNSDYNKINKTIDYYKDKFGSEIRILNFEIIDISSTEIRYAIQNNNKVNDCISDSVYKYIKENNLYR